MDAATYNQLVRTYGQAAVDRVLAARRDLEVAADNPKLLRTAVDQLRELLRAETQRAG